jgi:hypothetical protein
LYVLKVSIQQNPKKTMRMKENIFYLKEKQGEGIFPANSRVPGLFVTAAGGLE